MTAPRLNSVIDYECYGDPKLQADNRKERGISTRVPWDEAKRTLPDDADDHDARGRQEKISQ